MGVCCGGSDNQSPKSQNIADKKGPVGIRNSGGKGNKKAKATEGNKSAVSSTSQASAKPQQKEEVKPQLSSDSEGDEKVVYEDGQFDAQRGFNMTSYDAQ